MDLPFVPVKTLLGATDLRTHQDKVYPIYLYNHQGKWQYTDYLAVEETPSPDDLEDMHRYVNGLMATTLLHSGRVTVFPAVPGRWYAVMPFSPFGHPIMIQG